MGLRKEDNKPREATENKAFAEMGALICTYEKLAKKVLDFDVYGG